MSIYKNNVDISVIIPVYNNDNNDILRCINSICYSKNINYEVIIIDDGSNLVTAAFLDSLTDKFQNINVIHQKNKGVSAARNYGVQQANGNYVTFVDADDFLTSYFFDDFFRLHSDLGDDVDIYYGLLSVLKNTKLPSEANIRHEKILYRKMNQEDKNKLFKHMIDLSDPTFKRTDGYIGRGSVAKIIKKEMLIKCPFPNNLRIGEDVIWNLELLKQNPSCVIVNSLWYYYKYNPNSATHLFTVRMVKDIEAFLIKLQTYIDENLMVNYLNREIELILMIKRAAYEKGYKQFYTSRIVNLIPWNFALKWKYGIHLNNKMLLKFLLLKIGVFDFIYEYYRLIKAKL